MSKLDDIETMLNRLQESTMQMAQHLGPMRDMVTDLSNNTNKRALTNGEMRKLLKTVVAIIENDGLTIEVVRDIREITLLSIPDAVSLINEFSNNVDKAIRLKMAKIKIKEEESA